MIAKLENATWRTEIDRTMLGTVDREMDVIMQERTRETYIS